ncbi:unnamed protein product [Caenorhabditis brenneri]
MDTALEVSNFMPLSALALVVVVTLAAICYLTCPQVFHRVPPQQVSARPVERDVELGRVSDDDESGKLNRRIHGAN